MSALESWRQAIKALHANWARGALTVLGVVIGVMALVDLRAITAGAQADVAANLTRLGPNIVVIDGEIVTAAGGNVSASDRTITQADAEALARLRVVTAVAPHHVIELPVSSGRGSASVPIVGITPTYEAIHNYSPASGRLLTAPDERFGRSVIVLGRKPADKLAAFGGGKVGSVVRILDREFVVVGIYNRKGKLGQDDLDNQAFVPLSVDKRVLLGSDAVRSVDVRLRSAGEITAAQDQMTTLLRRAHRLPSAFPDDFSMEDQASIVKTAQSATGTFQSLALMLGAIALVVGGIGITNMMLVSVAERTREIGIRKAIGAEPRTIATQFLLEAIVLCAIGGVCGVAIGVASAGLIGKMAGWTTSIAPATPALAFAVSAAVGLVSGYYPARRAARLNPIDALRHE